MVAPEITEILGVDQRRPEITEILGLKQCRLCDAELLERDRFCRRCGVSRSRGAEPLINMTGGHAGDVIGRVESAGYETRLLPGVGTLRRPYSGALVGIVTQELSEKTSWLLANHWARLLIRTLVAVPLWLMIMLLSPLDAYVAAKDLARQV